MAVCPKCKQELASNARFCGKCGTKIPKSLKEEEPVIPLWEEASFSAPAQPFSYPEAEDLDKTIRVPYSKPMKSGWKKKDASPVKEIPVVEEFPEFPIVEELPEEPVLEPIPKPVVEPIVEPVVEPVPEIPAVEDIPEAPVQEEAAPESQEDEPQDWAEPAEPVAAGFYQDDKGLTYYRDETGGIYYEDEEGNPYNPEPEEDYVPDDVGETVYQKLPEEPSYQEPVQAEQPEYQNPWSTDDFGADNNYRDGYPSQPAKPKASFADTMNKAMASVAPFFQKIGAAVAGFFGNAAASLKKSASSRSKGAPRGTKSSRKALTRALIFGGIGAAALIAVIVISLVLWNGRSRDEFALYLKDGEMYYTDFSKKEHLEVTSRLGLSNSAIVSQCTAMSEDHKRLFFPDKIEGSSTDLSSIRFTLYYRDVTKPKEEPEKIDSDIRCYTINKAGDQVVYVKGDNGYLYFHDLKDKEKIAQDVTYITPAGDIGDTYAYQTSEGDTFLWTIGQEPVEIQNVPENKEEAAQTYSLTKTLGYSHFYYLEDGDLYMMSEDTVAPKRVASDVTYTLNYYKDGGIYYVKESTTEHKYMDFVTDDLMASDKLIEEPKKPNYPKSPRSPWRYNFNSDEEYEEAKEQYNKDLEEYEKIRKEMEDAYNEAYALYTQKSDRDYMREALETKTITIVHYALYFFDGATETLLEEEYCEESRTFFGVRSIMLGAPAMSYTVYDRDDLPHFLVSELNASAEVGDAVTEAMNRRSLHAAFGDTVITLEDADEETLYYLNNNQDLYYFTDVTSYNEGDLYKISYVDGNVSEPEKVDTDVVCSRSSWMPRSLYFNADTQELVYFKDPDEESGSVTLCLNGEEIAEDVYGSKTTWICGKLAYCTDWNSDKRTSTLHIYENGESIVLGERVYDSGISCLDGTNICFLTDYSEKRKEGELYRYNGGEAELVAEDVSGILFSSSIIRGYLY